MAKEGSTIGGIMDSFGTSLSIALQYGVPLEVLVNKFSHTRFEPMGHTTNKDIRIAKSVVDYIARWLGLTFMSNHPEFGGRNSSTDIESVGNGPAAPVASAAPIAVAKSVVVPVVPPAAATNTATKDSNGYGGGKAQLNGPMDQFARFQSDAPGCDNCGSITVRNGNCYLCHNCGNSMGCS
jgi:ribonucleoside-diphosphate reductase alpha chain